MVHYGFGEGFCTGSKDGHCMTGLEAVRLKVLKNSSDQLLFKEIEAYLIV